MCTFQEYLRDCCVNIALAWALAAVTTKYLQPTYSCVIAMWAMASRYIASEDVIRLFSNETFAEEIFADGSDDLGFEDEFELPEEYSAALETGVDGGGQNNE